MNRVLLIVLLFAASLSLSAQGRKLPNFSFKDSSIDFADANRAFNHQNQFTDTLSDQAILNQLVKILSKNTNLLIDVVGHTAINETDSLGYKRATFITSELIRGGIDKSRLSIVNKAHSEPIISDKILFSLPSPEEKEAANQKNRRVEIKVAGKREE